MLLQELNYGKAFWQQSAICILLFVSFLICLSGNAAAQDVKVGDTKDGCDGSNRVRFHGKNGDVFIKAPDSQRVELPSLTNEIVWFCGGDRNRSANDEHFNIVKISRKDNGAITWGFFKSAPPAPAPDLVRGGSTKDACDSSRHVKFQSKGGEVSIKAGQSRLVELASPRNTLNWDCVPPSGKCPSGDTCDESASNPVMFDTVQIDRAGNGAISWVFYLKKNSVPTGENAVPDYVRNATGSLRVGVSAGSFKKPLDGIPPGLLKTAARNAWLEIREKRRAQIVEELTKQGKAAAGNLPGGSFALQSLTLAGADGVELRTAAEDNSLWLKILAHGNVAQTKFALSGLPDPQLKLTFDIEVEINIKPESLLKKVRQAETAVMKLAHFEIEGTNVAGNFAQEVFKSKLRNAKTRANNISEDVLAEINEQLSKFFPTAPKDFPLSVVKADVSVTRAGTILFCLHTPGAPACQFSGTTEAAHSPGVLDTDIDRCESKQIWLRDAQKRKFVSIAKGQSALVEVESREFPWFCGGDKGPEELESATGPVGTYLLRVSRGATGDRIDWKFLSWR